MGYLPWIMLQNTYSKMALSYKAEYYCIGSVQVLIDVRD